MFWQAIVLVAVGTAGTLSILRAMQTRQAKLLLLPRLIVLAVLLVWTIGSWPESQERIGYGALASIVIGVVVGASAFGATVALANQSRAAIARRRQNAKERYY